MRPITKLKKMFPLFVRYFTEPDGVSQKQMKFDYLKNETLETIFKYCIDILRQLQIPLDKLIALCGNNPNTNFGGLQCGQCNIFYKTKKRPGKTYRGYCMSCPYSAQY